MKLWCLFEASSAQGDSVGLSIWERLTLRCAVIALPWIRVSNRRVFQGSIMKRIYLLRVFTSAVAFLCLLLCAFMTCFFTRFLCIGSGLDLNML